MESLRDGGLLGTDSLTKARWETPAAFQSVGVWLLTPLLPSGAVGLSSRRKSKGLLEGLPVKNSLSVYSAGWIHLS